MVAAAPTIARIFRKRAKSSITKLPPSAAGLPSGRRATMSAAATRIVMAMPSATFATRSPRKAPSISSAMAPIASSSSGAVAMSADIWAGSVIGRTLLASWQGCGFRRVERVGVILDQSRHRRRRHIEHEVREHAEQQGQQYERRERDDLAEVEILEGGERRLVEGAEDHLAIEPERVAHGEDDADGGERRHPDVDLEGAEQGEEFADETGGAGQADVGEGEHHERRGVERFVVDEPAVGGDLTRVHAVVDDAHAQEQRARHDAVRDHLENAAGD